MRTLCMMLCMLAVVLMATSSAAALEIRVAPATLVLSSPGGKLSVHTNVPYPLVETVVLKVDGKPVAVSTFADDCGNLVAQCTKAAAAAVIEDFEGKTKQVTVTLTVNGDPDSETIRVKK